ncbi:M15 family metallopeptidase [Sphaerisporangium flaviroseum]|uniref:D-alanyl-D-alanine dipeptidase n=1 Tax=Sphaerisporangium flaviroseum TaxID=509199 RepID=A0ABP7J1H0_9ACTN
MTEIVLLSNKRIVEFLVRESGEPLQDLRTLEVIRLDRRLADQTGAFAHVRVSVADRLVVAQTQLPRALHLLVVEGYRPPALQARYFAESLARHRAAHPDWDEERARIETSRYVAPLEVAPHTTGGAVDLTLCDDDGVEIPMGTSVNATPPESDEACYTAYPDISLEAMENRRILCTAMTSAGFVNYPTEWWHWSYGDRYWAFITGARYAKYGTTDMP